MADPIFDQVMNIAQGQRTLQQQDMSMALQATQIQQTQKSMANQDKAAQLMQATMLQRMMQRDKESGDTGKYKDVPPALRGLNEQIDAANTEAKQARELAAAIMPYEPSWANQIAQRAEAAERTASQLQGRLLAEKKDLDQELGGVAMAYNPNSDPAVRQAQLDRLSQLDPKWDRQYDINRDANDKPMPGEKTDKAMAAYAQSKMSANQQSRAAQDLLKLKDAEAVAAQRAEDRQRELDRRDRDSLTRRASVDIKEAHEARMKAESEAKLAKIDTKMMELKEPNNTLVASQANRFRTLYPGLSQTDSQDFARDVLMRQQQILKDDILTNKDGIFMRPGEAMSQAERDVQSEAMVMDQATQKWTYARGTSKQFVEDKTQPGRVTSGKIKQGASPQADATAKFFEENNQLFSKNNIGVNFQPAGKSTIKAEAGATPAIKNLVGMANDAIARGAPFDVVMKRLAEQLQ